jgi:ATP-dependent Lhr-like helicase
LHEEVGAGYPGETLDALWNLVWRGLVTNDTFHALRAYVARPATSRQPKRQHNLPSFRSRRTTPPSAQGRWSLVPASLVSPTEWSHAFANQLLNRYGVLTRESAASENLPGGFTAIYDVLKALEESGRIRRGYFVAGLGATQFALPAAVDLLRSLRNGPPLEKPEMVTLAATDPANLYGSVLRWPAAGEEDAARGLTRSAGASVVLRNGELVAYLRRNNPNVQVFLPSEEPDRSTTASDLSHFLAGVAQQEMERREDQRGGMLISQINGQPAGQHFLAHFLQEAGFHLAVHGLNFRRAMLASATT